MSSGRALERFAQLIEAQGGNPAIADDPAGLPQAAAVDVFRAPRGGRVTRVEPRRIGRAVVELGGGRASLDDVVDPTVGFVITARPGDRVAAGEPIASIFARDDAGLLAGAAALDEAITIGEAEPALPLLAYRVTAAGVEPLAEAVRR